MKKYVCIANLVCAIIDLYMGWGSLLLLNLAGAALCLIEIPE